MVDNVYIVVDFAFPNGFAGASRIMSYAKGFAYHKTKTTILCIRKTEAYNNILNKNARGVTDGVDYKYLSNSPVKSKFVIIRRFYNYLMAFRLFVYSLFQINKNSTVIFYSAMTHAAILLKLASIFKGFNLLKEENEHPTVRSKLMNKTQAFVFHQFHYNLFDGIIVITNKLYNYFKNSNFKKPILHIPMLVDMDRFNLKVEKTKSIIYSGMLSDSKDGVNLLIRSFAEISKDYPEYKLVLIGIPYFEKQLLLYEELIKEFSLTQKVIFVGRVPNNEIPEKISKATVLVLPRPDSIQAQNGFPTKLGEYLATGNPVVVTSVGEISDYLTDNVNAFIAVPGNMESLTEKLKESLGDLERSIAIGLEGRKTAEEYFDNKKQAKRILAFINDL